MVVVTQLLVLLLACGYGLATVGIVERRGSLNQAYGLATMLAADAAVERALADLLPLADFSPALSGALTSSFRIGGSMPVLPDGSQVDLAVLTNDVQAITDSDSTWGGDRPRWTLFAFGPINGLSGVAGNLRPEYLVAWVSDDRADGDNDPAVDSNRSLIVLGRAYGVTGSRTMEVIVRERTLVSWKEWQ